MPFAVRCRRCNYRIFSTIKEMAIAEAELHAKKSHKRELDLEDFDVVVISRQLYNLYLLAESNKQFRKAFWRSQA